MKKISTVTIFNVLRKIALFALDTIAPPDPIIRKIEGMTHDQYMCIVKKEYVPTSEISTPHAILVYKDPLVKAAILEVKSYGNKQLALLLGSVLYTHLCAVLATQSFPEKPLIIPIPITRKSLRNRGWNQCELILDGLKKADIDNFYEIRTGILYKIRETADQVGKNRQERFKNLEHSFMVKEPEKVQGRTVIVFDDILTTGATFGEAARALSEAGASRLLCIALAH